MQARFVRSFPLLFVLLWSTGFLGARLGLPHTQPLTFSLIRYLAVIGLMAPIAWLSRAPWPGRTQDFVHIGVAGLLIHGVYLGGVFMGISQGLPAGVASLIVGLQPLLTAVGAGWLLKETVLRRQWFGLLMGLAGVGLVVAGKLGTDFGLSAVLPVMIALIGITLGTLYQKRFCPALDWRTGAVIQFVPTAVVTGVAAYASGPMSVEWSGEFVFALGWLVLVLSLGAVSLLNWLIRQSSAVNVASLFYLVPPCTAVFAWALFGETLSGIAVAGMLLAVTGVYMARK
jgi:drug/metabolite transporter (DMT)-like permease